MTTDDRNLPPPLDAAVETAPTPDGHVAIEPVAPQATGGMSERDRWRRAVTIGLLAYVVSRICVLGGAIVRASQIVIDQREDNEVEEGAVDLITSVFTSWDGLWYLELARLGYPERIPDNITYEQTEARAAFFPMFPGAVRALDSVLPGGDTAAALLLNFVLGGIAVVLVGLLARRAFSSTVAARAMVLFAMFPGSFVLSFAYSEALFIVFAASCLLLLLDEQWLSRAWRQRWPPRRVPMVSRSSSRVSSRPSSRSRPSASGRRCSPW